MTSLPAAHKTKTEAVKEIMEEATSGPGRDKLYSGAFSEHSDDDKHHKFKFEIDRKRYTGDQIRDRSINKNIRAGPHPPPIPPTLPQNEQREVRSSSSLSVAFDYILSPVRYIASAFSSSPADKDKAQEAPDKPAPNNNKVKVKEETSNKPEVRDSRAATAPPKRNEAPKKLTEPPVKIVSDFPPLLPDIPVHGNALLPVKNRFVVQSVSVTPKEKKSQQKGNNNTKKSQGPKKSQSQPLKPTKLYAAPSPRHATQNLKRPSSPKPPLKNVAIQKSSQMAYRVTSGDEEKVNTEKSTKRLYRLDFSPELTSWSNNSSKWQLSPGLRTLNDEMSFVPYNCSNTMYREWGTSYPSSARPTHPYEFYHYNSRPRGSIGMSIDSDPPSVSDHSSNNRETEYCTFESNLSTSIELSTVKNSKKIKEEDSERQSDNPQDQNLTVSDQEIVASEIPQLRKQAVPVSHKYAESRMMPADSQIIIIRTASPKPHISKSRSTVRSPASAARKPSKSPLKKRSKNTPSVEKAESANLTETTPTVVAKSKTTLTSSKLSQKARPVSSSTSFSINSKPEEQIAPELFDVKPDVKIPQSKKKLIYGRSLKSSSTLPESPPTTSIPPESSNSESVTKSLVSKAATAGIQAASSAALQGMKQRKNIVSVESEDKTLAAKDESWLANTVKSLSPVRKEEDEGKSSPLAKKSPRDGLASDNTQSSTSPTKVSPREIMTDQATIGTPTNQPRKFQDAPGKTPLDTFAEFIVITSESSKDQVPRPKAKTRRPYTPPPVNQELLASDQPASLSRPQSVFKSSPLKFFQPEVSPTDRRHQSEFDPTKNDSYPNYYSPWATLHGEFP